MKSLSWTIAKGDERHTEPLDVAARPRGALPARMRVSVEPQRDWLPGEIIAEKYRFERVLGRGGMGVVVAAMHMPLRRRVALKLLREIGDPTASRGDHRLATPARLLREARALSRLESPHIVRILDVVQSEWGDPILVLEFLEGESLSQRLHREGALPIDAVIGWMRQVCAGMAEAHALDIIHRDLKPSNLFVLVDEEGVERVKILDFGIARTSLAIDPASLSLTCTQSAFGSPQYMSPEQIRSVKDVDARSDVWSLGVTLFELLTGQFPFRGDTPVAIAASVAADPPACLRALRPDIPPALERLVTACLEKDPHQRPQSANELARHLATLDASALPSSAHEAVRALSSVPLTPTTLSLSPLVPTSPDVQHRERRTRERRALGVSGVALLGLVALAASAIRSKVGTPPLLPLHASAVIPAMPVMADPVLDATTRPAPTDDARTIESISRVSASESASAPRSSSPPISPDSTRPAGPRALVRSAAVAPALSAPSALTTASSQVAISRELEERATAHRK